MVATGSRLVAIDALRGFAALWVCAFHARQVLWIGLADATARRSSNLDPKWWFELATFPFSLGVAGVTLFFVLSGYCIHRPQARFAPGLAPPLDRVRYLARRIWRIYPVLLAALLLTLAVDRAAAYRLGGPLPVSSSWSTFWGNLFMLQGLLFPTYGSNGPLWSLSIEFHLYLAYFGLLAVVLRHGPYKLLLGTLVISLVSQAFVTAFAPKLVVFLPYLFAWTLGMFVAEAEAGRVRISRHAIRWLALGGIGLGLACLAMKQFFTSTVVLAVGFAALVHMAIDTERGPATRGERFLAWVGTFSFSLYVIHEPLQFFLRAYVLDGKPSANLGPATLAVVVCLIAAWVFFRLVEIRSLKLPGFVERMLHSRQSAVQAEAATLNREHALTIREDA